MGRIKTTLVKRTARQLIEKAPDMFGESFEENKKALGHTLPSNRMRNMIAGYITRIKRNTHKILDESKSEISKLPSQSSGKSKSQDLPSSK